ncbi:MAG: hypothetical protein AB1452_10630 [Pseudomonadota bacterium]
MPHRYPARALAADYLRASLGGGLTLGPLALAQPAAPAAWALAAGAALFLVYFARTVCRQLTRIELDEAGIRARGPLGAAIRWGDLRSLRLAYYSTRRDREEGWMQLKLRDARHTIRIDSDLERFAEIACAAASRAEAAGLELDPATRGNLRALGA